MRKFTLSLIIICSLLAIQAFAAEAPKVEMFSPQGGVKDVRQAVARFSDQMVSFGDPRHGRRAGVAGDYELPACEQIFKTACKTGRCCFG